MLIYFFLSLFLIHFEKNKTSITFMSIAIMNNENTLSVPT